MDKLLSLSVPLQYSSVSNSSWKYVIDGSINCLNVQLIIIFRLKEFVTICRNHLKSQECQLFHFKKSRNLRWLRNSHPNTSQIQITAIEPILNTYGSMWWLFRLLYGMSYCCYWMHGYEKAIPTARQNAIHFDINLNVDMRPIMFTEIVIQCSRPSNNIKCYSLFDCYFRFSARLILVHNGIRPLLLSAIYCMHPSIAVYLRYYCPMFTIQ